MKKRCVLMALSCFFLAAPSLVVAAEESAQDSCSVTCSEGEVLSSFLDGGSVSCLCLPAGPGMVDDSNVQYGGTEPDEG